MRRVDGRGVIEGVEDSCYTCTLPRTMGATHMHVRIHTPPGEKVPFSIQALWYDQKTRKAEHKDPKAYSIISALNVQVRTNVITHTFVFGRARPTNQPLIEKGRGGLAAVRPPAPAPAPVHSPSRYVPLMPLVSYQSIDLLIN